MKIAIVMGTRPELIKLAPVLKALKERKVEYIMIRTGQHYSNNMWTQFMAELDVPLGVRSHNLAVNNCSHAKMVGLMMQRMDPILQKEKPDLMIVQGDSNSGFAGALAAAKLHIPIAHIEAGLRSYDKRMPEEHNRIVMDHLATYLFPPTPPQLLNLKKEGLAPAFKRIPDIVGNTIVDTIKSVKLADGPPTIKRRPINKYVFVTFHREENVDCPRVLRLMLEGILRVANELNLQIIFPVHPRTRQRLTEVLGIGNEWGKGKVHLIDPIGYGECLRYQKYAQVCITDAGGIVEESCILGTPTVVVRKTTDRPEAVEWGASITVEDISASNIFKATKEALELKFEGHPYGENVTEKILEVLL